MNERKALARQYYDEICAAVRSPVEGDGGLSETVVETLVQEFESETQTGPLPQSQVRTTARYWRDHGQVTGELMRVFCERYGGNAPLYARVGRVHDLDYLGHPHDGPGQSEECHPLPLARAMRRLGVHPAICAAIIEHAPYIDLDREPSSRLAAALSACEDIATLAALRPPPEPDVDKALSPEAHTLLRHADPKEFVEREGKLRVEINIERYVNAPLRKAVAASHFVFEA